MLESQASLPFNRGAKVWVMDPDEGVPVTGRFGGVDEQIGQYLVEITEDHDLGQGVLRRINPPDVTPFA